MAVLVTLLVQERKLSPLEAGGTLKGSEAAGKVCSPCFKLSQRPYSGFVKHGQC